jgi:protein PsiE
MEKLFVQRQVFSGESVTSALAVAKASSHAASPACAIAWPDERLIIVRWIQGDFMGKQNWAEQLRERMHGLAESLGNLVMEAFHYVALFAIGAVTAWAAVMTFFDMLEKGSISVDDILLLFIYLELAAMVGIYFKTNHMPIRFMIYVAITALTRLMISDISHNHKPDMGVVMVSGAILLLAAAIFVVRYASSRFPSVQVESPKRNRNVANDAAEKDDTQSDD